MRMVAQHVYPDCAASLLALDVTPDMSLETAHVQARELLERLQAEEVLILTDVFGATPCNAAQRLADGTRVKVVTGISVPMLWRALCYSGESLDSLVNRALAGAAQGAMQVSPTRPQNQARNPADRDANDDLQDQQ